MGILKGQTAARLILQTNLDFTNKEIDKVSINYIRPDKVKGSWDAAILEGGEAEGKIYVDFSNSIKFTKSGSWKFNAKIIFNGGSEAYGEIVEYHVGVGL